MLVGGIDIQKEALASAVQALQAGDATTFFACIAASHVLDGLVRAMERKWPKMDGDLIHEAVSVAVDALFKKVSDGGVVAQPAAFMWKAASNTLANISDRRLTEVALDDSLPAPTAGVEQDRSRARSEAIRLARSFLPHLGKSENLRLVMAFIIDCAEAGEYHVENAQIAEATGLSVESVRRWKHRGFERLKERARAAGINLETYVPAPTGEDQPDDEEGE